MRGNKEFGGDSTAKEDVRTRRGEQQSREQEKVKGGIKKEREREHKREREGEKSKCMHF